MSLMLADLNRDGRDDEIQKAEIRGDAVCGEESDPEQPVLSGERPVEGESW